MGGMGTPDLWRYDNICGEYVNPPSFKTVHWSITEAPEVVDKAILTWYPATNFEAQRCDPPSDFLECWPASDNVQEAIGDPVTSFRGHKIRFTLPPDTYEEMIGVNEFRLLAKSRNWATEGNHQWFTDFIFQVNKQDLVTISALKRLDQTKNDDILKTVNVTVEDISRHKFGKISAYGGKVGVEMIKNTAKIGPVNKEEVDIRAPGISMKIFSSKANKFIQYSDQLDHIHLDMKLNNIDLDNAYGTLPELWGVKEVSKHTLTMLGHTDIHV